MAFGVTRTSLMVVILGAGLAAVAVFSVMTHRLFVSDQVKRTQLVDITNAFTQAYAKNRPEGAPVPATFRRMSMDHFALTTKQQSEETASHGVSMPGVPGLEMNSRSESEHIQRQISAIAAAEDPQPIDEHRWENFRFIGRSYAPAMATSQDCVDCHNQALDQDIYEVGDVMGAFVVESDLTHQLGNNATYASGVFLLTFLAAFLLLRRERLNLNKIVQALQRQVTAEQELRESEAYASFLASHDALTGLANRKMFHDRLTSDIEDVKNEDPDKLKFERHDVYVILADLDDFKQINDTMGHDAGDAVLCAVADRLKGVLEPLGALTARFGGDEFAAVLTLGPGSPAPDELGRALITDLQAELKFAGSTLQPSASLGIAGLRSLKDSTAEHLMKSADVALYAAKHAGKNVWRLFDGELRATMGRRAAMRSALPNAIANDEITPVLQPQINLQTGNIIGFEALARWAWRDDPISPTEFVPLAEELGIVHQLDLSILDQAAQLVVELMEEFDRPFRLSSNISTLDFRVNDLVETVQDILMISGLDPDLLTLEITESVFVANWERVREQLGALQKQGVRIALDDFGTGYSSLSYLMSFPFDTIKVDRSFVQELDKKPDNLVLLSHIVNMAHDFGKGTVVEGLETLSQIELLSEMGVQSGQGFYFSPGLDFEEARSFVLLGDLSQKIQNT
ncbi:MAG: putative bifunctional diguanylate cyclase/phosphodiesterase [Paracoccaceae bacterium]